MAIFWCYFGVIESYFIIQAAALKIGISCPHYQEQKFFFQCDWAIKTSSFGAILLGAPVLHKSLRSWTRVSFPRWHWSESSYRPFCKICCLIRCIKLAEEKQPEARIVRSMVILLWFSPLRCCVYPGDSGLLVCRLDNPSLAAEKESRLLLYQDMDSDLDNLSCSERLGKAQFTRKNRGVRW